MTTFIALITETDQGELNIRDSVTRAAAFHDEASRFGVAVKDIYWTLGQYDGVLIFDAPDDETAAALLHHLSAKGAVRTNAMRAFTAKEMRSILQRADDVD